MKFLMLAALAIPALAMPEPVSGDGSLLPRDFPKLNQYRTLDDCRNNVNITYHAAPVSGQCYPLDPQTGAFFYNTGSFLYSHAYTSLGCSGTSYEMQSYSGNCVTKGSLNSVKMW